MFGTFVISFWFFAVIICHAGALIDKAYSSEIDYWKNWWNRMDLCAMAFGATIIYHFISKYW